MTDAGLMGKDIRGQFELATGLMTATAGEAATRSGKFFMRLLVRGSLCKCVGMALLNHPASGQLYFWEMLAYPPHDCFVQVSIM